MDIENGPVDAVGEGGGARNCEQHRHTHTTMCKIDSQQEATAQHRKFSLELRGGLKWRVEVGRRLKIEGVFIHMADSCYTAETNTTV